MIDPLNDAIYQLEQDAYMHGLRSGTRKRGDADLNVSKAGTHHESRVKALALADAYGGVVRAAVALFDCQCEFEDDPGACSERQDALDDAVIAYKKVTPS